MSMLKQGIPQIRMSVRCASSSRAAVQNSTVCPEEIAFFKKMARTWWDDGSSIHLLKYMTPVRMELLQKYLTDAGLVDPNRMEPVRPFENLKVLDVGCGGGFLSEAIAKLGANVTGIDANSDLIQVAQEHVSTNATLKDSLNYRTITVEEFALENEEKYDVVVSSEVIEHVLNKEIFACNALKCLRPGGSAFFTTMNRTLVSGFYYIYVCEDVLKIIPKGVHQYAKFMRPKEMVDLFRKYNCVTTDVDGFILNPIAKTWVKVGCHHFNFALHATKLTKTR